MWSCAQAHPLCKGMIGDWVDLWAVGVVLVGNGRGGYCKKGIPHADVGICVVLLYVEKKSCLCRFALLAKFLDLNKPWSCKYGRKKWKKLTCMTFLCPIELRNKTVAHRSPYSLYLSCSIKLNFDDVNAVSVKKDYCDPEILLPCYNWHHISPLYYCTHITRSIVTCNKEIIVMSNRPFYRYSGHIEFIIF